MWDFPDGPVVNNLPYRVGDEGPIPALGSNLFSLQGKQAHMPPIERSN